MRSLIFHVDVNSAFLSWESAKRLRDNPDALDLRTINAVIGGDAKAPCKNQCKNQRR